MPGMGPAPSENRVRRNADTFSADKTTVTADGRSRGPNLPRGVFCEKTREWYATWRRSAQGRVFTPTDWQRLLMLAYVVDDFFGSGDAKLLAEIRQNESLLGATPLDRLRGRIAVEAKPAAEKSRRVRPEPGVTSLDSRRRRLAEG